MGASDDLILGFSAPGGNTYCEDGDPSWPDVESDGWCRAAALAPVEDTIGLVTFVEEGAAVPGVAVVPAVTGLLVDTEWVAAETDYVAKEVECDASIRKQIRKGQEERTSLAVLNKNNKQGRGGDGGGGN